VKTFVLKYGATTVAIRQSAAQPSHAPHGLGHAVRLLVSAFLSAAFSVIVSSLLLQSKTMVHMSAVLTRVQVIPPPPWPILSSSPELDDGEKALTAELPDGFRKRPSQRCFGNQRVYARAGCPLYCLPTYIFMRHRFYLT
jgi:hypothetical protein